MNVIEFTIKDCGMIYDVKQSADDIIVDRHCHSTAWELYARCLQWPMILVSAVAAMVAAAVVAAVAADNDDVAAERAASQSHHRHMNHDVKPPAVHRRHHKG